MANDLRLIEGAARDRLILDILKRIDSDEQVIAAHDRASAWEYGWREQLEAFRRSGSEDDLIPKFIKPGRPVRWRQQFYDPVDPWHELNYVRMVQGHIGDYMAECASIHEFGCGTGFNLHEMALRYPDVVTCGYDFSPSAVLLTKEASESFGLQVQTRQFDMAKPRELPLGSNAGVYTFGSVEQLGPHGFRPFIDYLIAQRPRIVVHIEPVPELLDEKNLVDWLSLRFTRKRGYTEGLLSYLGNHADVRLLEAERSWFGSTMIESYARLVWRVR